MHHLLALFVLAPLAAPQQGARTPLPVEGDLEEFERLHPDWIDHDRNEDGKLNAKEVAVGLYSFSK